MGVEYYLVPGMYQRRTAVWEGRGATARPWEAMWSKGVASVFGVYCNKNVFKDIGSDYYVVYSSCVYRYSPAGYTELSVVPFFLLQCLVYNMLSKTRRSSGSLHRVIGKVLVLGLIVVVYRIPYSSSMFNTAVVLEPGKM